MKTKIIYSLLLLSNLAFSQNEKTKSADYLYKKYEFDKASQQYLKLANDNFTDYYILKQLADCYYYISKNSDAEKWYALALENQIESQTLFRYAQVLKLNGKENEYELVMDKFKEKFPKELITKNFNTNSSNQNYNLTKLEINTSNSDFGGFFNDKTLYYASSRNLSGKKFSWNNEPSLDIYYSKIEENNIFNEPIALNDVNSNFNDGPATFTTDGKSMYFSSESYRLNKFEKNTKDLLKYSKNMIFKASLIDNKWSSIIPLSINDVSYSTSNPCISRDGKILYFSSNRPGGFGGVDIWKVNLDENGFPNSVPENLGNKVNTEANESFPFINNENSMLYFSSNGRNGFGAYDIYIYDLEKAEVKNLGKSINSKYDDFAFSYFENDNIGFLSSNRDGNDNLYLIKKECEKNIEIQLIDEKTGKPIANSDLTLLDENKNLLQKLSTNSNGNSNIKVECNKKLELISSKSNYEKKLTSIEPNSIINDIITIKLNPFDVLITDKEVILKPIYFDFNKSNITFEGSKELDKLVKVMMENPEMIIFVKSHTDSKGDENTNLKLSYKRAKATVDYILSQGVPKNRISGNGFGETQPKIYCSICSEEENMANRRSEFLIVK